MQNLKNGWFIEWEEKDSDGEWHTTTSDYMSKEKAEKIVNNYNNNVKIEEGSAYLCYDEDFDIEEGEE